MPPRVSSVIVAGVIAVVATATVFAAVGWQASRSSVSAGFWWTDGSFVLPLDQAARIGGPLTSIDLKTIERISMREVEHAFDGLRVNVTGDPDSFWRVSVVGTNPGNPNIPWMPFASAGESRVLGPLGSWGSVGFLVLAHNAIEYAPPAASRHEILAGIGRGIGRAAVHEFAHQALGLDNTRYLDNRTDAGSYEYRNADRPSQYYGDLHWTTAWPALQQRFGR